MHSNPRSGADGPPWRSPAAGSAIDARDILRGIWRRKFMVLALTLITAIGGVVFVTMADREYTSRSQVLLENLETPFDRSQPNDVDRRQFDETEISSQVQVLRSRDLAKRVVNDLNLNEREGFGVMADPPSMIAQWLIDFGLKSDPRKFTPEQRALTKLESDLRAYQVSTSRVIEIEGTSGEPKMAADLANALAEVYVVSTREAQSESTGRARNWLSEEIESLRKKVVESEAAVEEFRVKAGLIQGPTTMLSTQELAELNTQIILAEAARTEAEAKAKSVRELLAKTGAADTSSAVLASPLIQRLREQQVVLQRTLAELSSTYLSSHPRILSVKRELEDLNRQIRSEALKVVAGLEQEAKVAASREETLRESLNSLKARAGDNSADQVKLRALEREAAANRTLLESFLNRFSDASARQEVLAQPGIARIIARADPPTEPSFPKSGPIILLATLSGFTIGLGLAFMAEVMKAAHRAQEPDWAPAPEPAPTKADPVLSAPRNAPVEAAAEAPRLALPVAGEPAQAEEAPRPRPTLPSLCVVQRPSFGGEGRAAVAAGDLEGAFAISLRPLVSWCMSLRQTLGVRRIALLAGEEAGIDGAAAVMALARSLAAQDVRVLLLDMAGEGGRLSRVLGSEPRAGLRELLAGQAKFADVIFKDEASTAHILAPGRAGMSLADPTISRRMERVLEALDQSYDLVLVHAGEPLNDTGERNVVAKCHAAVLLASGSHSGRESALLAELAESGLSAVQIVRLEEKPIPGRILQRMAVNA